jgi:hypothetical protein
MIESFHGRELRFEASKSAGEVGGLLLRPTDAKCLLVFAHGAGAGMRNTFMERMSEQLAHCGVATFRYNFPYMEQAKKRIDPKPILLSTVRAAIAAAHTEVPQLPLFAGGKSMGGRMTSLASAESPLEDLKGILFFGFPLHPAGTPSTERADHLRAVNIPMLFLQGTRDSLADLSLLTPVCAGLGSRATLHIIEGADHSFHVPKASGRTDSQVIETLASVASQWMLRL